MSILLSLISVFALLSGCNRTVSSVGSVSFPHDWVTDPGSIYPFQEKGALIWEASDFDRLYFEHWRERKDYEATITDTIKSADLQQFVRILSEMNKKLVYTEKLSDSFDRISDNGLLPAELGDRVYHFGPMLPDNGFLQIYQTAECSYLYFRLENKESDIEKYHVSIYSISLSDFKKLDSFLGGLDKSTEALAGKPVLYLYPEYESDITVKLRFDGLLSVTYPAYENGWNVRAYPDGRLVNYSDGREYSYLFWEGFPRKTNWDLSEGYCIAGADTASFLQEKLSELGLIPKEYNELIVYWLPHMQNTPFNLITFQWEEYERITPLDISPEPDSMLRVFMVFTPLQEYVEISPPPQRPAFVRQGFTVVEWGALKFQ